MHRAVLLAALVLACAMAGRLSAQAPAHGSGSGKRIPRTADGRPDLQGTWTNGTLTPFERPAGFENKPYLTEAEAADVERRAEDRRANPQPARPDDVGGDNEAFVDSGYKVTSTRQASLVMDPPDGRIPFRPETEAKKQFNVTSMADPETMSPWDRCITRGPTTLLPAGYNNGYQIVQAGSQVMLLSEMIHEARVVPTDGRPHAPATLRSWSGDSRGRWEGDTLVIDTTNFRDRGWISTHAGSGRLRGVPHTSALHLTERFTLRSADELLYELTIDDPPVYTRPFTVVVPFHRDSDYQIYEYACHEGNKAIELFLRGARAEEREGR